MDITRYGEGLSELHNKHQKYLQMGDARALSVLKKMLEYARELGDNELIGYVYHSMAFVEHFTLGNYRAFLKDLRLSAQYLFKCEDQTELMHVYYLVAVDAINKGLYDLSYQYFNEARNIAAVAKKETAAAILEESIAHILMQIGAYKEARKYLKQSMQGIRKDTSHPHYYSNLMSCMMNDGIACLGLGKTDQAVKKYEDVVRFMNKNPKEVKDLTLLDFELFRMRILITEKNTKKAREYLSDLLQLIRSSSQIHLYMEEIGKLVRSLMSINETDSAEKLINAVSLHDIPEDAGDALRILTELKIDCYKAANKKKALEQCYISQNEIPEDALLKQKRFSSYSQELIQLINAIAKEREKTFREKEILVNLASVDPLTGIPNRYRANNELDDAYENAYSKGHELGIVYIDVDGLKAYNDKYGHQAGDEVLINFGKAIEEQGKKAGFFAARFGGDEFIMICNKTPTKKIREFVAQMKKEIPISFSAGIYNAVPKGRAKSWDFLNRADIALYKEKARKR